MKNNVKDRNILPKEKKSFNDPVKNLTNLNYTLTKYQIVGIEPPESLLIELKMAELLAKVESVDTIKVKPKSVHPSRHKINHPVLWFRAASIEAAGSFVNHESFEERSFFKVNQKIADIYSKGVGQTPFAHIFARWALPEGGRKAALTQKKY